MQKFHLLYACTINLTSSLLFLAACGRHTCDKNWDAPKCRQSCSPSHSSMGCLLAFSAASAASACSIEAWRAAAISAASASASFLHAR